MTKARDLANGGFGLVLIKPSSVVNGTDNGKGTVSFSAQSSVTLNNIFTSTYDNYQINITVTNTSTDLDLRMRVMDGLSAQTGNFYNWAMPGLRISGTEWNQYGTSTSFYVNSCESASQPFNNSTIMCYSPLLEKNTTFNFLGGGVTQAGTVYGQAGIGIYGQDVSIEGLQFLTSTGNMTGTVSVYGYNK